MLTIRTKRIKIPIKKEQKALYIYINLKHLTMKKVILLAAVGIHISKAGYLSGGYFESLRMTMWVIGSIMLVLGAFLCNALRISTANTITQV